MSSDSEWENIYLAGKQIMRWPSSELISAYFRHKDHLPIRNIHQQIKVMELGFGTGPNLVFFKSLSADIYGLEISPTAYKIALDYFPELSESLHLGSFEDLDKVSSDFDIIYDRAAVTHAPRKIIQNTINKAFRALRPGGLYFAIEWFSTNHSALKTKSEYVDIYTRRNFEYGQFYGLGSVHFSDKDEILRIFKQFNILEMKEKIVTNNMQKLNEDKLATWNIVAKKPL